MKIKLGLVVILGIVLQAGAQSVTEEYIKKWEDKAVDEMKEYGIPASITLAQGILESQSGESYLASKAKNHFGIKCHLDWEGGRVYKDDDKQDECFRAYDNAEESFRDHSLFLKERSRYASLFEESPTDYKAWARGLKKAGYATDPEYPERLIDLIERYDLHRYDLNGLNVKEIDEENYEEIYVNVSANYVEYVTVREGDTFEKIAELTDKRPEDLLKYNELRHDDTLKAGQRLYLQPKRNKAAREFETYTVKEGETMYSISQKFAVELEELYERNVMPIGHQPQPGDKLQLR